MNFKKGQKVWDFIYGWGIIKEEVEEHRGFAVDFKEYGRVIYTADGVTFFNNEDGVDTRTLFFKEVIPTESALNKRKWRARKGKRYYFVMSSGICEWVDDTRSCADDRLYNIGNYFQTKEEAMNSKIYKAFHEVKNER